MYTWRMPRVSRYTLPHHQEKELSEQFSNFISSLRSPEQIQQFLDEFLTLEEKSMLSKRLALFIMLHERIPSDIIQAILSLSRETVRIYQQQFPFKSEIFQKTISRLHTIKKIKSFIADATEAFETIMTSKTNMKSRAKLLSGKLR